MFIDQQFCRKSADRSRPAITGELCVRNPSGELDCVATYDWRSGILEIVASELTDDHGNCDTNSVREVLLLMQALSCRKLIVRSMELMGEYSEGPALIRAASLSRLLRECALDLGLCELLVTFESRGSYSDMIATSKKDAVSKKTEGRGHLLGTALEKELIDRALVETKRRLDDLSKPPGPVIA